jgi:hypothetical protein
VPLNADAVNRRARVLERFDEVDHSGGFVACGLDVVFVDLCG